LQRTGVSRLESAHRLTRRCRSLAVRTAPSVRRDEGHKRATRLTETTRNPKPQQGVGTRLSSDKPRHAETASGFS
jgi:hypothetical protein